MSSHASRRRVAVGSALTALVASPLALAVGAPADANTSGTGLVINEVYGGGGNTGAPYSNDFIELYNPTSAAVDVSTWSVQYASASGTSWQLTKLVGTVPAKSTYLVQEAVGGTASQALPTPDATGVIAMSATAGKVALVSNQTALTGANPTGTVDLVGFGSTATGFEGTGPTPAPSNALSVSRTGGADTDNNAADFTTGAPTPTAATTGGTGSSPVTVTDPGSKSGVVNQAITPFTLQASGGTSPYTWTATGLPAGVSLDKTTGTVSGTPTAAGTSSVTATATDSATTPASGSTTFSFTVTDAPASSVTIAQIEGDNTDTSPLAGQTVTTTGVVTAAYPTGGLAGFDIQTGGTPNTPNASDAVFVYAGTNLPAGSYPAVGTQVDVTGKVSEFNGLTELNLASASGLVNPSTAASQGAVVPLTVVPGTDCAQGACADAATVNAAREQHESELVQPTGSYTVTDPYDGSPAPSTSSSNFGEIGLAAERTAPLIAPTEDYDAQNQAADIAARTLYNTDHEINIDDGSSLNYTTAANTSLPLPWFTPTHDVRVGAAVTFVKPFVLSYGNSEWRLEPPAQVTDDGESVVHVQQTRSQYAAGPANVGGDLKLATFNVLNFFPTTGVDYVNSGLGQCTYYTDRQGNKITTNSCGSPSTSSGNGPRGAADTDNLTRQQTKIVAAINTSGADIVSLEEIENSVKFGKDRDAGLQTLVNALNAAAGAGTWSFPPSPAPSDLPTTDQQDVIRTAFIYKTATVTPVGASKVLSTESSDTAPVGAFANAREPLAQAFKKKGAPDSTAFGVIVNHFKSKGSGTDDMTGQGNANPDRVRQANALLAFANTFQTDRGLTKMFLVGDFNAYSQEDPVQAIEAGGYSPVNDTVAPIDQTYSFSGQNGSLDHVFANAAAKATVSNADVWAINAYESVYYEYSRFNYNVTNLYDTTPFRASDHNPEIVGINVATTPRVASTVTGTAAAVVYGDQGSISVSVKPASTSSTAVPTGTVTVTEAGKTIGTVPLTNGSGTLTLLANSLSVGNHNLTLTYSGDDNYTSSTGSVVVMVKPGVVKLNLLNMNDFHGRIDPAITTRWATTIEQLRAAGGESNTLLLSAGDNIGASLFASASQKDNPTLDVLNALGLDASAVGNHEFDQGFSDLTGHVANRSNFKYLGANVYYKGTTTPALPEYQIFTVNGVKVGVIGAVTQETASLVSPSGIADLDFGDPVDAVNRVAGQLHDGDPSNGEADVIVAEYHEGAPAGDVEKATLASNEAASPVFTKIVTQTSPAVNAIFTGHTHKLYAYSAPVPGSTTGATRPVVQTGNYGDYVGHVVLTYDGHTGQVTAHTEENVAKAATDDTSFPRVAAVKKITDQAVADAAALGNKPVGTITADITTAFTGGAYTGPGGTYRNVPVNGDPKTGRDDRASESTLGDLVAQVLKDGVSSFAKADIGAVNPGGLRDELFYAGSTGSNPQNTDGVVTYAEANSVLPFANTVSLVKLTGAQFKQVLEQQYQTDASGNVPSRSYLQLGLSSNVRVTTDPTKAAGSRITSVYVDGAPLDPAKTYTVSTFNFLATGGDNFRAFTQGTSTDTGLLDAQLFRDYFASHPGVAPDFARQQVTESGLPTQLVAGTPSTFTLSKLDMTSLGSPANTTVVGKVGDTQIGSWPVTNGTATITATVPASTTGSGVVTFTAQPSGTVVTVPYVAAGGGTGNPGGGTGGGTPTKATTQVVGSAPSVTYGQPATVHVTVSSSTAGTPSGTVAVTEGTTSLGTVTLAGGSGDLVVPATSLAVGSHTLTLTYSGDTAYATSTSTTTLVISKVSSTVSATADPATVTSGGSTSLTVTVAAAGYTPTGTVEVRDADGTLVGTGTLDAGSVTVPVGPLTDPGTTTLGVRYLGDDSATAASTTATVQVSPAPRAEPQVKLKAPARVTGDRAEISVEVGYRGQPVPGRVRISYRQEERTVSLGADGRVDLTLKGLKPGNVKVTAAYLGTDRYAPASDSDTIKVVKKKHRRHA